jgi:hypothetical protein
MSSALSSSRSIRVAEIGDIGTPGWDGARGRVGDGAGASTARGMPSLLGYGWLGAPMCEV